MRKLQERQVQQRGLGRGEIKPVRQARDVLPIHQHASNIRPYAEIPPSLPNTNMYISTPRRINTPMSIHLISPHPVPAGAFEAFPTIHPMVCESQKVRLHQVTPPPCIRIPKTPLPPRFPACSGLSASVEDGWRLWRVGGEGYLLFVVVVLK